MTPKQRELYDFICGWIHAKGFAPSYREMQAGLEIKHVGQVCQLLNALEAASRIRRDPRRSRSIELTKPNVVQIQSDVMALTDEYARKRGISRESAANDLLRVALGTG